MKILIALLGVVVLLVIIFLAIGLIAPASHEGRVSREYDHPPDAIWNILNDIEGLPDRRKTIQGIEMLEPNPDGFRRWKETLAGGGYAILEITEEVPEKVIALRISESSSGITGTWRYEIEPSGTGSHVTITESSNAGKLMVRSILAIAGRKATLRQELRNIEKALEKK